MPRTDTNQNGKSSSGKLNVPQKKKKRYSKATIIRNRIIFAVIALSCIGLISFATIRATIAIISAIDPRKSNITAQSDNSNPIDQSGQSVVEPQTSSEEQEEVVLPVDNTYPCDKVPLLVNKKNFIPSNYTAKLADVGGGYKFREDGAQALLDMIAAAKNDGIKLFIVSAYRTNERQTSNYNNRIAQYESQGLTKEEATLKTEEFIAPPGTSEHTLGLAVDLNSLEQAFELTKEFEWLSAHCAEFGFILRYAKDKEATTGFRYEPWHYRFVGTNHSHAIKSSELCLEEYSR